MQLADVITQTQRPVITAKQFYEWLDGREDVEVVTCREHASPADDEAIVRFGKRCFSMHPTEITYHSLEEWEALALEKRGLKIMTHMTRIVGYYSQLNNWNLSKIAELHDRQAGQYELPQI